MPGDQIIWSQYCHTYVFWLRWVKDIKFLGPDIQKMKSQKPFLDSKLERIDKKEYSDGSNISKLETIEKKEYSDGSNIWKEGILRWVEYLTKTVWIASSRQRLLPHQGWFPPCLLSIVWTGCGRDEEVAREMMMNCYEDHIHTSTLLCYFSLFSGCWNMTIIYLGN